MKVEKWFVALLSGGVILTGLVIFGLKNDSGRYYSRLVNLSFETQGRKFMESISSNNKNERKFVNFSEVGGSGIRFEVVETGSKCIWMFSKNDKDLVDCGEVTGSVEDPDSIKTWFDIDDYRKIIKRGEGIYQLIEYKGYECSSYVTSILVVGMPEKSGIKRIVFWPESVGFEDTEYESMCQPRIDVIMQKMDKFERLEGENPEETKIMIQEIELAKTFRAIR
jgi:hypothetical protein